MQREGRERERPGRDEDEAEDLLLTLQAELRRRETFLLRNTWPVSLWGLPAVSIPCGLSREGLPIGMQIVGRPFDEATLLRAARALERELGPSPAPEAAG